SFKLSVPHPSIYLQSSTMMEPSSSLCPIHITLPLPSSSSHPDCTCSSGRVPSSSGRSQSSDDSSAMARFHSIMRLLAYLILLALAIHIILSYVVKHETGENEEGGSSAVGIYPFAAKLCQYLELKDTGVEGEMDSNEYKLKGVTVLFRHGERSPIVKDDLSKHHDCGPFRDIDRRSFEYFMKTLDSNEFKKFLKVDKEFKYQPFYPLRSECSPGNMTAEGALQLSRLGNHLRRVYEKTNLFNKENELNVNVTVSPFRRTFQSAVAFLSSFLFPMKGIVDEVFVKYSNETFHCTDPFCQCPSAFKWRSLYEKQHLEYFLNDTTGLKEKTERIFGELEISKRSKDPFQMMDVILGRHMCRRSPLPCVNEECVSFELLKEMLDYTTHRGLDMFNRGNDFISARLHTAEAQSILGYVAKMGDELRLSPQTHKIKIFSGHDTTVGPVLRTLRIPFVDFPRYAAHIVFEIYHDRDGMDFLRLIFNGDDITDELPFCGGKNMCPMSTFTRFSRSGIFAALGFSNVTQLCDPSLTPQPNNAYV
ncbi:hypothetical protein PENTCL1PPCAC_30694, partial [Pristionchus entomophagus]